MKMSSSLTGPAVMPSGGEEVRSLYSWKRRREAMVDAMVFGFWVFGSLGGGKLGDGFGCGGCGIGVERMLVTVRMRD